MKIIAKRVRKCVKKFYQLDFLREINYFTDLVNDETKCAKNTKKALRQVEQHLHSSGLYYDTNLDNGVNRAVGSLKSNNSVTNVPNSISNNNNLKSCNGNLDEVSKVETLEKELKDLKREVQKLSSLEDSTAFKGLQKDVGQLKKDSSNQQTIINTHLKPLLDRLYTLSADLDSLKSEVKAMKGLKLAPGQAPFKTNAGGASSGKTTIYVRVALSNNRSVVHEFPTDENGNLSFTAVNAVYPGKFRIHVKKKNS